MKLGLLTATSLLWLALRTGRKPSRITYPCQQAAVANLQIYLLALYPPLLSLETFRLKLPRTLNHRQAEAALLISTIIFALGSAAFSLTNSPTPDLSPPVSLNLKSQTATASVDSSDLFFVENASETEGNMDKAMSTLLRLMENHGLFFHKTSDQPNGLIAKDNVVLVKVNSQWPSRGGTNTDLVKSIIGKIVSHPEGFVGEIVVADNGQERGSMNWDWSNAFNRSQSMQEVVNAFSAYKVSTWLWDPLSRTEVNEYAQGDFKDGYIRNNTANTATHHRVSYPKFKTAYGTRISFKHGIWSNSTGTYDSERLKVINVPVLKTHGTYGVTASVKHYMGVVSAYLTDAHSAIRYGAMGTEMAETRFPTISILDSIWVNANPVESGYARGPQTPYEEASFTNMIGASQDPVALDYWASKHILIPAAISKGYTEYSSIDPDYAPVTPGLSESFHNYLERSMHEIKKAGYQATMNETEMNVYVPPVLSTIVDFTPDVVNLKGCNYSFSAYIEPQQDTNLTDVDVASILLNNTIHAEESPPRIGDYDNDGIQDMMIEFNRTDVCQFILSKGIMYGSVALNLTGYVSDGAKLEDTDTITVRMPGDINIDGIVDIRDIASAAASFGSCPQQPRWNYIADENEDGKIDIRDMASISKNFGKKYYS